MTLFRGLANDLTIDGMVRKTYLACRTKWVNEEFVQLGTQLAIAEMLRGGVTCFNDMYFYAENSAQEVTKSGMRACISA